MSDENYAGEPGKSNLLRNILIGIAAVYILASLFLMIDLRTRVRAAEDKQKATELAQQAIQEKLHLTNKQLEQSVEELGSKVGMTQEELSKRTAEIRRQQQNVAVLSEEQKKQGQVVSQVTGDVAGVRTELGGAKTDIASTKTDLEATKAKLEKAIGDLGIQSGLIATNRSELETLKKRGDRNYYEFTLRKKQKQPIATVTLELRKTDAKRSKFTLNVMADDKTIEKKDRTANEPLQFYTTPGGNRQLYELVINTVGKDVVSGYLSTPKM